MKHSVNTPYIYREEGIKIFETSLKGDQDFLVKIEGSPSSAFSKKKEQALLFNVWIL